MIPMTRNPILLKRFLAFQQCRGLLIPAVEKRVEALKDRHSELIEQLTVHNTSENDAQKIEFIGREIAKLAKVSELAHRRKSFYEELDTIALLREEEEVAVKKSSENVDTLFEEEVYEIKQNIDTIDEELTIEILNSSDPDANLDAILEIRAGTGGDEASLFAVELLRSYEKYCQVNGWKWEILDMGNKTDIGGIREVSVSISNANSYDEGTGVYGRMRYESGVHRVQRVPVNDIRIHTSAVSVAILPDSNNDIGDENSYSVPASELKIETMRASGAGGQHVNTTESAVRITHIPTGITASIQDERSQHKNRAKAMKLINARVFAKIKAEEMEKLGSMKSEVMGGGTRSERIRTYNFPQDRCTDHRCKVSEHGLERLMMGGELVDTFFPYMQQLRQEFILNELEENDNS